MPISRKDFEEGLDDTGKSVLAFLKRNSDEAFTSEEIAGKLGLDHNIVIRSLNDLYLNAEAIDRVRISGIYYYASLKEE